MRSGFSHFGNLLDSYRESFKKNPKYTLSQLRHHWSEIVGEAFATNTYPAKLSRGELLIVTHENIWLQQVLLHQRLILKKIHEIAEPTEPVKKIRGFIGKLPKDLKAHQAKEKLITPTPLDKERVQEISSLSQTVQDPQMRELINKVITAQEHQKEWKKQQDFHECPNCGHFHKYPTPLCLLCQNQVDKEENHALLHQLSQQPWLNFEQTQKTLPEITLEEYNKARDQLTHIWRQEVFFGFLNLYEEGPLPPELRSKIVDLVSLKTQKMWNQLQEKHFRYALPPRWHTLYLNSFKQQE